MKEQMSSPPEPHLGKSREQLEREAAEMQFFCENKFSRKFCTKFFPSEDASGGGLCQGCRYSEQDHTQLEQLARWQREGTAWRPDLHVQYTPVDDVTLRVNFLDELESLEKLADLAIVADDTHPRLLLNILLHLWRLKAPNFVIGVTGGSQVSLTPKQNARFKQELCRAVSSTRVWVAAGGTLSGVDALVANALKELQYLEWLGSADDGPHFYLLALANWNCVDASADMNKWSLGDCEKPYQYKIKHGKKQLDSEQLVTSLNPLYSHFLCLEGGVKGAMGLAHSEAKGQFLDFLSKPFNKPASMPAAIPTVLVVIGGGFDTVREVANALAYDIPIVICEGTGGAADVIAGTLRFAERQETAHLTAEQESFLLEHLEGALNDPKQKGTLFTFDCFKAAIDLNSIKTCIARRESITVYRMDQSSATPLDQCILKALLNGKTAQSQDPVALALTWNRCDDIIRDILLAEGDINKRYNISTLMTRAIMEDKIDFIALFIEFGLEFVKFLTTSRLAHLYDTSTSEGEGALKSLLEHVNGTKNQFNLKDVYNIVYYFSSSCPQKRLLTLSGSSEQVFEDPFRELFFWAVLTGRMEASQFFWRHCQNPLAMALIASRLWWASSTMLGADEADQVEELAEHEATYLELAQAFLDTLWAVNKTLAHHALQARPASLGGKSLLDIAGFIEAKHFIAHPCCQVTLEHQWKGGLRCRLHHVLLSLIMPLYLTRISAAETLVSGAPTINWEHDDDSAPCSKPAKLETTEMEKESAYVTESCVDEEKRESEAKVEFSQPTAATFTDKLVIFYGVPVTKFVVHMVSYVMFLWLFSLFYLFHLTDGSYSPFEIFLVLMIIAYVLEMVQMLVTKDASWAMKLKMWSQSEWNVVDLTYLSIFLAAFSIRGLDRTPAVDWPSLAKGLYGMVVVLMWIRVLRFYQCNAKLGPMWIMIRKMLYETVVFMAVLGVIIVSAGITLKVLMNVYAYEDAYNQGYKWIVLRSFFMNAGELFIDAYGEAAEDMDPERSNKYFKAYSVMMVFQLFIGNALMLNLLVAIYGQIYNTILEISDMEWKNEMFMLVREYQFKTHLPPPLSIIESILVLYKYFKTGGAVQGEDKDKLTHIFETYSMGVMLKQRDLVTSPEKQVQDTIKCVDQQHSLLHDLGIIVNDMQRAVTRNRSR